MTIKDLTNKIGCTVTVPLALWVAAELLADARSASNSRRSRLHDRGKLGNKSVDLHGAFGELMLQRLLRDISESAEAQAYMAASLFVPSGGSGLGDHPDLIFVNDDATQVGIDAKTFDCSPIKRFFAIADSKHEGLRGKVAGYFIAVAAPYGRKAALARLVPYEDVDRWPIDSLRRDPDTCEPIGNASRNLALTTFVANYCPSGTSLDTLRKDVYPEVEISQIRRDPKIRAYLLTLIPSLSGVI